MSTRSSPIKAILFDLDDTLFDYEKCHQAATKRIFEEISVLTATPLELVPLIFELAQKEVKTQLLWTAASHNKDLYFQKIFEKMSPQLKYKIRPKQILQIFDLYRKTFYHNITKEKSTLQILKFLRKKGVKSWIVTDSSNYTQLKKIVKLWIEDYIDIMVSSEEAGMDKPHSSSFLLAMYKLGVTAHECIMVGDNIQRDIEGAQWLGIGGIWLNRYHKNPHGIFPQYSIENTEELYQLLQQLIH